MQGDDVVVPSHHWTDCEKGDAIQRVSVTGHASFNATVGPDGKIVDECSAQIFSAENAEPAKCSETAHFPSFTPSWSGDCQPGTDAFANLPTFEKCCDKTKKEDCTDAGLAPKPYVMCCERSSYCVLWLGR